jgi:hypothetical protein
MKKFIGNRPIEDHERDYDKNFKTLTKENQAVDIFGQPLPGYVSIWIDSSEMNAYNKVMEDIFIKAKRGIK